MPVGLCPSWKSGHATLRETEAALPSLRAIFAGWEAARNAGLDPQYYHLADGNGLSAGRWEIGIVGEVTWSWDADARTVRQAYHPADPARVRAFLAHWRRLLGGTDYVVRAKDCVTDEVYG